MKQDEYFNMIGKFIFLSNRAKFHLSELVKSIENIPSHLKNLQDSREISDNILVVESFFSQASSLKFDHKYKEFILLHLKKFQKIMNEPLPDANNINVDKFSNKISKIEITINTMIEFQNELKK